MAVAGRPWWMEDGALKDLHGWFLSRPVSLRVCSCKEVCLLGLEHRISFRLLHKPVTRKNSKQFQGLAFDLVFASKIVPILLLRQDNDDADSVPEHAFMDDFPALRPVDDQDEVA